MKPIHFVYPTAEPVQGTYRFLGCGRYTVSEDAPGADYQLVTTKHIRDIEELNDTASELVPDVFDTTQSVYEIRDDPTQQYQGYSKSLAYVLARISCARELKWEHGDLWCTGVVKLEGTRPYLKTVNDPEFTEKLNGFLDPQNADTLFIVPASNITSEHESLCEEKQARSVLLRNAHSLNFQEIASQKTILLVGRSELEQLVNFLFHTPKSADVDRQRVGFPSWEGSGVGSGGSDTHKRPLAYSTRPHVGFFVDREDLLAHLQADLRDPQKVLLVIDGLAGIGKTTVAAKLAEEMENEFCGIYWTKCTPETDLDQLLAELAYFLSEKGDQTFANVFANNIPKENKLNFLISSLGSPPYPDINVRAENVSRLKPAAEGASASLRSQPGGLAPGLPKFLLVFDDVHELLDEQDAIKNDDLRLLFTKLLTQSHASKILLISRAHPQFYRLSGSQSKNTVASIRQQAGIALLRQLGVDEDDALLEQAYRLTAGHPLAMELLAELAGVMPLEDILTNTQLFWSDIQVVEQLLQEFNVRLTDDEQVLLSTLSILPRPATREMIMFLTDNPNITPILTSLTKKVLLSFDRAQKVYKQHDLVRDFYRLKLDDQTKREIHLKAAEYYEQFKKERENKMTFQEVEQRLSSRYHYFQAGEYEKAAQVLVEVFEYLREWGYLERCRTLLEETLTAIEGLSPTRERQLLIVDLLVELSWVEELSEGSDKALERCQKAEKILKTVEDKRRQGNLYHAMGNFLFWREEWEESGSYLTQSFKIKKLEKNTNELTKVLRNLRLLYLYIGTPEKIELIAKEGLEVCKQQNDVESQAVILKRVLGATFDAQYKLDEALLAYQESLLLRKPGDFSAQSLSLRAIGNIFRKKREFQNALKSYKESLILAKESGDVVEQSQALIGIGRIYRDEGKIEIAVRKYNEILEIIPAIDDLIAKVSILNEIADSYKDTGKINEALELLKERLELSRELGDMIKLSRTLNSIGDLYFSRFSNMSSALIYYEESLGLEKKLNRPVGIHHEMSNIATVYQEQGKLDEALKIFEELLATSRKRNFYRRGISFFRKIKVLNGLGTIYCLKGEYHKAFEFCEKSLELAKSMNLWSIESETLCYFGELHIALGNYEKALATLKESLELRRAITPFAKTHPLTNIADIYYHQDKFTEAMTTCEESLALSRQYGGRIQAGRSLHLMARIRMKEQRYDEALPYVQEAVKIFCDTGSRHLPEAEATLEELQGLRISKDSE